MLDDHSNDFIDEGEENDLGMRMNALNEEYIIILIIDLQNLMHPEKINYLILHNPLLVV